MNATARGARRIERVPLLVFLVAMVLVAPARGAAASGVPAPANDNFANALRLSDGTNWLTPDMTAASLEPGEVTGCNLDGSMDRSVWYSLDARAPGALQVLMGGREGSVTTAVYGPFRQLPASAGAVGAPLYCVYGTGVHKALTEKVAAGLYVFQLTTVSSEEVAPTDLIRHWSTPVPPPEPPIHQVVSGDTLWAIARDGGVPLQTVVDANPGIADPRLIHPGEQVAVPVCARPSVAPTGWWTGDQTATDRAGHHDARLVGDTTYGKGMVDGAFRLDGSGDYVSVPNDPSLQVVNRHFTVAAWVRYDTLQGEQVLVEKWVQHLDGTPSTGWTLTKLSPDVIRLEIAGGSRVDTPPLGLVPGAWYHVAARLDGSQMTIFVNGAPVASGTTDASFSGDLSTMSSLKFGHRGNPTDTPGSQDTRQFYLHGAVDEVQLWVETSLSDQDILAIAAAGAAGTCRVARASIGTGTPTPSPQRVAIVSPMTIVSTTGTAHNYGTFTTSGSTQICASGTVLDTYLVYLSGPNSNGYDLVVDKTFTCADGSGTILFRLLVHGSGNGSESFAWTVSGGTGAYTRLRGLGMGSTVPTSTGVTNRYAGFLGV